MDPLSVAASIAGLATAAGEVAKILKPYVSAIHEPVPPVALQVYAEVESTRVILSAVQRLVANLSIAKNTSLIQVDDIVAILTDGVLVYSDLEETIGELGVDLSTDSISLRSRLVWAHRESKIKTFLTRLQGFKASTSLILSVLSCDSNQQAEQHRLYLTESIDKILEGNQALAKRLMVLENTVGCQVGTLASNDADPMEDAISAVLENSTAEPPAISFFEFEADLGTSRAYRRAKHVSMDYSFRSSMARSSTGSILSGISLSEVSNISIIALPIYAEDLSNPHHYGFRHSQVPTSAKLPGCDWSTKNTSILQHCQLIRQLLLQLPEFPEWFEETDALYQSMPKNPLRDLKHVCQMGTPLLALINKLRPSCCDLHRHSNTKPHRDVAIYEFITACKTLNLGLTSVFTVIDLTGDGYVGFFKVVKTLESILGELVKRGILQNEYLNEPMPSYADEFADVRDRVKGFLDTERRFFEQMRTLLVIKDILSQVVFNGNQSHAVFGPLHRIVDYQALLLIAIETEALKEPLDQHWGSRFGALTLASEDLKTYASFSHERITILSAQIAARKQNPPDPYLLSLQQFAALSALPTIHLKEYEKFIESLITLFQIRGCKKSDFVLRDLKTVARAIASIQTGIVHAQEQSTLKTDLVYLKIKAKKFGRHGVWEFGELVLCGRFPFCAASGKVKRYYRMYLFQRILLFCKEKWMRAEMPKGFRSKIFPKEANPSQSRSNISILSHIFGQNIKEVTLIK